VTAISQHIKVAAKPSFSARLGARVNPATIWLVFCTVICGWFVIVPVGALFFTAFTEDTGFGPGPFSLSNFVEAYGHWSILKVYANSLIFASGTAALTFLMGGAVAFVVERTDAPGREVFHSLR